MIEWTFAIFSLSHFLVRILPWEIFWADWVYLLVKGLGFYVEGEGSVWRVPQFFPQIFLMEKN